MYDPETMRRFQGRANARLQYSDVGERQRTLSNRLVNDRPSTNSIAR